MLSDYLREPRLERDYLVLNSCIINNNLLMYDMIAGVMHGVQDLFDEGSRH